VDGREREREELLTYMERRDTGKGSLVVIKVDGHTSRRWGLVLFVGAGGIGVSRVAGTRAESHHESLGRGARDASAARLPSLEHCVCARDRAHGHGGCTRQTKHGTRTYTHSLLYMCVRGETDNATQRDGRR